MLEHLRATNQVEGSILEWQALQVGEDELVFLMLPDRTGKVDAHHVESFAELPRKTQIKKPNLQTRCGIRRDRGQRPAYALRLAG